MTRESMQAPAMRAALAFVGVSAIVLIVTLVRALRPVALPQAEPAASVSLAAQPASARPVANIQLAVAHDLFSPDRTAPDGRYRMPDDEVPDKTPRPESPKPTVLGTMVAGDGKNFATVQLGTDSPRLVHVGDKVGDWTVRSIVRGKVVIEGPTGRAEVSAGPGAQLSGR